MESGKVARKRDGMFACLNKKKKHIYNMFKICYIERVNEVQETGYRLWILQNLLITRY